MAGPKDVIQTQNDLKKIYKNLKYLKSSLGDDTSSLDQIISDIQEKGIHAFPNFEENYKKDQERYDKSYAPYINDNDYESIESVISLLKSIKDGNVDEFVDALEKIQSNPKDIDQLLLQSSMKVPYSEKEYYLIHGVVTYIKDLAKNGYKALEEDALDETIKYVSDNFNEYREQFAKRMGYLDFFTDTYSKIKGKIEENAKNVKAEELFYPEFMDSLDEAQEQFLSATIAGTELGVLDRFETWVKKANEAGLCDGLYDALPEKKLGSSRKDADLMKKYGEIRKIVKQKEKKQIPGTDYSFDENDFEEVYNNLSTLLHWVDPRSSGKDTVLKIAESKASEAFPVFNSNYNNYLNLGKIEPGKDISANPKEFVENICKLMKGVQERDSDKFVSVLEQIHTINPEEINNFLVDSSIKEEYPRKEYEVIYSLAAYISALKENDFKPLSSEKMNSITADISSAYKNYESETYKRKQYLDFYKKTYDLIEQSILFGTHQGYKVLSQFKQSIDNGLEKDAFEQLKALAQIAQKNGVNDIFPENMPGDFPKNQDIIDKYYDLKRIANPRRFIPNTDAMLSAHDLKQITTGLKAWLSPVYPTSETCGPFIDDAVNKGIGAFPNFEKNFNYDVNLSQQGFDRNISDTQKYFVENIGKLVFSAQTGKLDDVLTLLGNMNTITVADMKKCLDNTAAINPYSPEEYKAIIGVASFIEDLVKYDYKPLYTYNTDEIATNIDKAYNAHCNQLQAKIELKKQEEKAAQKRAEEAKAAEAKAAAQKKAEEEKLAAQKKAEEEKLAAQKKAEEAKAAELKQQEEAFAQWKADMAAQLKQSQERNEKLGETLAQLRQEHKQSFEIRAEGMIKQSIKELEAAKTIVNSDQYKALLNYMKDVHNTKKFDTDTLKENLKQIGNLVDAYLNHKAHDGVKTNTYKKLAAVQHINEWLSDAPDVYNYKRELITQETVQKVLPEIGKVAYNQVLPKVKAQGIEADEGTVKRVDDCICNIIQRADNKMRPKLIEARNKLNQGVVPKVEKQNPVLK